MGAVCKSKVLRTNDPIRAFIQYRPIRRLIKHYATPHAFSSRNRNCHILPTSGRVPASYITILATLVKMDVPALALGKAVLGYTLSGGDARTMYDIVQIRNNRRAVGADTAPG